MHHADERDADRLPDVVNGVREALYDLRYRWLGVRIGGPDATVRGQWLLLSVSLVLVFGGFFAIGRFFHSGAASSAGAPAAQIGASGRAIPSALSGGSPIAGAVPVSIAVQPRVQPATQAPAGESQVSSATAGQASSEETARSEVPVTETSAANAPPREVSSAPAPSSSKAGSAKPHRAPRKARPSKPSTGATFDTSE